MTHEEYKKLTQDYVDAFHARDVYMEQFFTSYINDKLVNKATKLFTDDEIRKTEKMEAEVDKLGKLWFGVAKGEIVVKD